MELLTFRNQKRYILISVAALIIMGLGTSVLTWQSLKQERMAIRKHLLLSAAAIARGIESAMGRGLHQINRSKIQRHRSSPEHHPPVHRLRLALKDLISTDGLAFVQISGPRGEILVSPFEHATFKLPENALAVLEQKDSWHSRITLQDRPVFIYATRLNSKFMQRHSIESNENIPKPPLLVVGLDMTGHIQQFDQFRTNAFLQTGFVLAVAVFLLLGTGTYMQRREKLQKADSLEKFNSRLLDNLPDGLLTIDQSGRITSANPAGTNLLGAPAAKILGLGWRNLDLLDENNNRIKALPDKWTRIKTQEKELEILSVSVPDQEKSSLLLICDRSELNSLERRLEQARKFATIGQMAAGLAHEIRNPLSTLRGFSQFFVSRFKENDPAREYARTMVKEADRLNRVLTDLLYMAGPGKLNPEQVDLPKLFKEIEKLLRLDIEAKSAHIQYRLEQKKMLADRDALIRMIINLVLNSLEAMDKNGVINISSARHSLGTKLEISDNGCGMDEKTRDNALEPFYTQKDHGTGLGLALVHRLVTQHGGALTIHSHEDAGTRIEIIFPENNKI